MTAKFYLKKYNGEGDHKPEIKNKFTGSMYVTIDNLIKIKEIENDPDFIRWIEKDEKWDIVIPEELEN